MAVAGGFHDAALVVGMEKMEKGLIADPLTLLQCCPATDGAAALAV